MHIHILGIAGTFMGGIAQLAKAAGHDVTGSDKAVYPPMSTQLQAAGIKLTEGYDDLSQFEPEPDMIVVGNAMSRGNPAVEYMLDRGLSYTSGPQWLAENILKERWVIAAAGTHGKTTTSSMVAWILEYADMKPGFLIGGVPMNFDVSARLGEEPFFVVEADEYDTAFFDKRSKFVHYHPRTLIMNNLEFDHADIFDDLAMIQRQFHHLVRTIPSNGLILSPASDHALNEVLAMGCWTPVEKTGEVADSDWAVRLLVKDGSHFEVFNKGQSVGKVNWSLTGDHNVSNGLMAIAAAHHAGVTLEIAIDALGKFQNVKRRMELKGEVNGVKVYDDFAHHPTAIETTLAGLRNHVGDEKIIAVLEPRSNTMRMGIHADQLAKSLALADEVLVYVPDSLEWDASAVFAGVDNISIYSDTKRIVQKLSDIATTGNNILVMSNGGFENIHQRILDKL